MNVPLFILLITSLIGISFWLGKKAAKESKDSGDFFLMGRNIGLFGLIMTLLATQIGGGALLGAAEEAYTRGWSVLFYPLGMVLGMMVLGLGYGAKLRKLNLTTVPEIFQTIYGSQRLRQIASLLSIASLFLILVGQGIAARKFFLSLGFHGDLLFVLFWGLLIAYTSLGGLRAVVKTDILQASFILLALLCAMLAVYFFNPLHDFTPTQAPSFHTTPWLTWLMMPLLFMLIEQDMGQRCFAAKNPRTVTRAALIASFILLLVSFVPVFFGTMAAHTNLPVEKGSSVLITSVLALTNPTVATFVICAVLMAISSTADSLLCSVSSNIVCDFSAPNKSVISSQLISLCVGFSTLILAFLFDNVVTILMFAYELAVSVLFVPVTMAVWTNLSNKRSAALSMSLGAASFITLRFWKFPVAPELISLGCSFAGFMFNEAIALLKTKQKISENP